MNTLKLTLSKLAFSCLAVLFSVSFFSFKSSAKELYDGSFLFPSRNDGLQRELYVSSHTAPVYYGFYDSYQRSADSDHQTFLLWSDEPFTVKQRTGNPISPTQSWSTYSSRYSAVDGIFYYINTAFTVVFGDGFSDFQRSDFSSWTFYESQKALINSDDPNDNQPEYANFGLKGFNYVAYTNEGMFTNRNFNLDYKVSWDGSTDPNYPITRVDYEIYGFSDRTFSNYDKSNGELLNSGEISDGQTLNVDVLIKDFLGLPNVQKVVVYFIPFSGRTEGNTEFIVCNFYEPYLEFGFRGFGVNVGHLLGMNSLTYGSGNIPVPYTDTVTNGVDSAPVAIVDGVPVLTIDQTVSGSFNTYNEYYYSHTTYAPVIYGDTTTINNYYDDHSSVISNNNSYTTIINNFNGSVDVDPESDAYANSIISFLTTLITFFSTFWSYCVVALGWLPGWVQVFVGAIFGLLGTLVISLGILKLMKGVL